MDTSVCVIHMVRGEKSKGLMCVSKKRNAPYNPASSIAIVTTITMMVKDTETNTPPRKTKYTWQF